MQNDLKQIAAPLVAWYKENKRELPWRRDKNPYHVWVSEIMLQQTRIEAVIEHYYAFMAALPDVGEGLENRLYRLCREASGRETLLDAMAELEGFERSMEVRREVQRDAAISAELTGTTTRSPSRAKANFFSSIRRRRLYFFIFFLVKLSNATEFELNVNVSKSISSNVCTFALNSRSDTNTSPSFTRVTLQPD